PMRGDKENQSPRAGLCLQLALEFVEEAPVGVFGDHVLRGRLDETRLAHAQSIKANSILGVVLPPFVVGNILKRLRRVVVKRGDPPSTSIRAERTGSLAHRSVAFRIARIARFVATGSRFNRCNPRVRRARESIRAMPARW